jgi:hypothetical protein
MHARLDELAGPLAACRADVLAAAARAPDTRWREGAWSVAEVLDHLRLVETGVSKLVHVALSRHPGPLPREMETTSVAHRLDHVALEDRGRRIMAPDAVRPRPGIARAEALTGLEASRRRLLDTLAQADGVALGEFSFPHPVLGLLDLYQWLLFVGQHERRHARQISETSPT